MTDNGNNPETKITARPVHRVRASGPILIVAILFVVGSFLAWYFTWFGRGLSDAEITKYLSDYNHPRHVQHAVLQVQARMERGDKAAAQWYPHILALAGNPETEFRLTAAWVMGSDQTSEDFHNALKKLLADEQPIVRRNAALALVRFNDATGRLELTAMPAAVPPAPRIAAPRIAPAITGPTPGTNRLAAAAPKDAPPATPIAPPTVPPIAFPIPGCSLSAVGTVRSASC